MNHKHQVTLVCYIMERYNTVHAEIVLINQTNSQQTGKHYKKIREEATQFCHCQTNLFWVSCYQMPVILHICIHENLC